MLDDNPILKERLMALGAFAGIAVFAVTAVDTMVSGGFDFGPGRAPYARQQPTAYVRVVDAAQYMSDRFNEISWDAPTFADTPAAEENLAGATDGSQPVEAFSEASGDDLYEEIASLYEGEQADAYEDTPTYEDEIYEGEPAQAASDDKPASAYENGSPW